MNKQNEGTEMAEKTEGQKKELATRKQHRKMKPWVKWTLIGVGGVVVIGGVTFLIVHGKKVPAKEVAKAAEVVAEAATTVA